MVEHLNMGYRRNHAPPQRQRQRVVLRQETEMKERPAKLPNGVVYELKKFYYDTAQGNHPGALAALLKLAPVAQKESSPNRTGSTLRVEVPSPDLIRNNRTP